jgi:hypothetical protein
VKQPKLLKDKEVPQESGKNVGAAAFLSTA